LIQRTNNRKLMGVPAVFIDLDQRKDSI